jgi:hypothetical protein
LFLFAFGLAAQEQDEDYDEEGAKKPTSVKVSDQAIVLKPLERRSIEWYKSFKHYKNDKILQALVAQYSLFKETPIWLWELLDWHISLYSNTKYGLDDRTKEAKERTPAHKILCLKQIWNTQKYIDNIVEPVQGILTKVHNPRINGLLTELIDRPDGFIYFVPQCLAGN